MKGTVVAVTLLVALAVSSAVAGRDEATSLRDLLEEFGRVQREGGSKPDGSDYQKWIQRFKEAIQRETADPDTVWIAKLQLLSLYDWIEDDENAMKVADDLAATATTPARRIRSGYEAVGYLLRYAARAQKADLQQEALERLVKLRAEMNKNSELFKREGDGPLLAEAYVRGLLSEAGLKAQRRETKEAVELCLAAERFVRTHKMPPPAATLSESALWQAAETLAKAGDFSGAEELLKRLEGLEERQQSMGFYVLRLARIESPERGPKYFERLIRYFQEASPGDRCQDGGWGLIALELAGYYAHVANNPVKAVEVWERILREIERLPNFPDVPGMRCNCWVALAHLHARVDAPCFDPQRAEEYARRYLKECDYPLENLRDLSEVLERMKTASTQPAKP